MYFIFYVHNYDCRFPYFLIGRVMEIMIINLYLKSNSKLEDSKTQVGNAITRRTEIHNANNL